MALWGGVLARQEKYDQSSKKNILFLKNISFFGSNKLGGI
jgi:hypothetical protein